MASSDHPTHPATVPISYTNGEKLLVYPVEIRLYEQFSSSSDKRHGYKRKIEEKSSTVMLPAEPDINHTIAQLIDRVRAELYQSACPESICMGCHYMFRVLYTYTIGNIQWAEALLLADSDEDAQDQFGTLFTEKNIKVDEFEVMFAHDKVDGERSRAETDRPIRERHGLGLDKVDDSIRKFDQHIGRHGCERPDEQQERHCSIQ